MPKISELGQTPSGDAAIWKPSRPRPEADAEGNRRAGGGGSG